MIVVTLGLGVIVAALAAAADPYRQTREFHEVVTCERRTHDCFVREPASVVGRRTYTTTHTDSEGHTTTTTHYEITWQRAEGARQAREVSWSLYEKAREGQPVTLRSWHEEVVGAEVAGRAQWFLPEVGGTLGNWLRLAFLGLGILLWGLLFGWWDGFFMLVWRTFAWMFMSIMPVNMATRALAYDLNTGWALVLDIVLCAFFVGVPAWMLFSSLDDW
ncbi:hypothetical protein [Streptosporangium sp. NPDC002524]|uniref:hypothetical protein n=1 Tax=Streptosporangium sp. NPDC002524 TaxID=3154537 RepID=UPI0033222D46